MAEAGSRPERTLEMAAEVSRILDELGAPSALIGAAALAVHGYPRATEDVDLAVATDPFATLTAARRRIEAELGAATSLMTPDADDPPGGVLTVTGEGFDPIQVVNFLNPLGCGANPGQEAVTSAEAGLIAGTPLRVVTVPYLVALKLYAGGRKSTLDVLELLARNPTAACDEIASLCARFGLAAEWDAIRSELRG